MRHEIGSEIGESIELWSYLLNEVSVGNQIGSESIELWSFLLN